MDQGTGFVVAAAIASAPASLAAYASMVTAKRVKTNHGKKLGQHMEDLVDWAGASSAAMALHQDSDNDLREVLGLPRTEIEFPKVDGLEVR